MKPYRGWTKEGKEVKGWLLKLLDGSCIIVSEAAHTTETHPHYPAISLGKSAEVVPKTVGQQTIYKDKKNRKIYGGDIIRRKIEVINPGGCQPTGKDRWRYRVTQIESILGLPDWQLKPNLLEIIGNMTESPELLEEKYKMREHTIELVSDGNLAFCTTCKCGEGELTHECCGRRLTEEERHRVYVLGNLDFIDGKWRSK